MLQLKNIKKDYYVGEQTISALKGVSLDFRKCEYVSILGPSGCGKTTLMNVVGGLDKFTSGDILINGKSTKDFKDSDWDNYRNKKIGFVFQSYNLIAHLSVIANVELALTLSGISAEERKSRAAEALEKVGLKDQLYKKPNQLSGGQMQRVAIARALVNSPEIILADEPTGALDTKTSTQILDILKEIAKERLVIMVTHNAELAETYSTRIIRMLDGLITEDSNPYESDKDIKYKNELEQIKAAEQVKIDNKKNKKVKKKKNKTSMSFFTALSLSLKNLLTKKTRTILTAVAGSIGIIGIALIMAVSNGMNLYIAKMQTDALSSFPVTISESGLDMAAAMESFRNRSSNDKFPDAEKIFSYSPTTIASLMQKNDITDTYVNFLKTELDSTWYNDMTFETGLKWNVYGVKSGASGYRSLTPTKEMQELFNGYWQMLTEESFFNNQYDVLAEYSGISSVAAEDRLTLVVDESNRLPNYFLVLLGLLPSTDINADKEIDFDAVLGHTFKIFTNDELYSNNGSVFVENWNPSTAAAPDAAANAAKTVTITSIARINQQTDMGAMSAGIGYSRELAQWLQGKNMSSDIVQWMKQGANALKDPFTLATLNADDTKDSSGNVVMAGWDSTLRGLGGNETPNSIKIYAVSFDAKELIKAKLNDYNTAHPDEKVTYNDMAEIMGSMITTLVDSITIVLIAFTAISLVVSSIMIAIITYVSVLERTKEIGILRAIGARKRDISSVFNAETFITGLTSGLLGVIVAYLLTIPINIILSSLAGVSGLASLAVLSALLLVGISVALNLLAGFIPAKIAARKDPVTALRSE